jgi:transcriptional regulator with XRE-family HTH domain
MLLRSGSTFVEIGERVGVTKVAVHRWATGSRKPSTTMRPKLKEHYGIPEDAWDRADGGPGEAAAKPPPMPPEKTQTRPEHLGGPFAMAAELERMARQQMVDLNGDVDGVPKSTQPERARVMAWIAATLNVLAKITGQYDLGRRLLQLPLWKRIEAELADALKGHPEAARAVAERFEALEREHAA